MNIVDKFILEENLEGFILDDLDLGEIALGIVLGNLGRIKSIGSRFYNNLTKSSLEIGIKAILLGRSFEILSEMSKKTPERDQTAKTFIIDQFVQGTQILQTLLGYISELFDYTLQKFELSLKIILNCFASTTNIIPLLIPLYEIKDSIRLNCSLFIYTLEELMNLNLDEVIDPEFHMMIVWKGSEEMNSAKLEQDDVLKKFIYRELLKLFDFWKDNNKIGFSQEKIQCFIDVNRSHFNQKELSEINGKIDIVNGYERPYRENEEKPEIYSEQSEHSEHSEHRDYREHSGSSMDRYEDSGNESWTTIKSIILETLGELREHFHNSKSSKYCDVDRKIEDTLFERFRPCAEKDEKTLYRLLSKYTYQEKCFTERSIYIWTRIINSLKRISCFRESYYCDLEYNISYIKREATRHKRY